MTDHTLFIQTVSLILNVARAHLEVDPQMDVHIKLTFSDREMPPIRTIETSFNWEAECKLGLREVYLGFYPSMDTSARFDREMENILLSNRQRCGITVHPHLNPWKERTFHLRVYEDSQEEWSPPEEMNHPFLLLHQYVITPPSERREPYFQTLDYIRALLQFYAAQPGCLFIDMEWENMREWVTYPVVDPSQWPDAQTMRQLRSAYRQGILEDDYISFRITIDPSSPLAAHIYDEMDDPEPAYSLFARSINLLTPNIGQHMTQVDFSLKRARLAE